MTASPFAPPPPADGSRVYRSHRTVRLADASSQATLRLDALARYLGEVAAEDVDDAGLDDGVGWLVRRATWQVAFRPRVGQGLRLATWCSGLGPRWAERATVVTTGEPVPRPVLQSTTLWVAVDAEGRPSRLSSAFLERYSRSAQGRRISSRLTHHSELPPPPVRHRPWPLRRSDLDLYGHVNNAIHWMMVDDVLHDVWGPETRCALFAELEYRSPIEPGHALQVSWALETEALETAGLVLWIRDGEQVLATAEVRAGNGTEGGAGE